MAFTQFATHFLDAILNFGKWYRLDATPRHLIETNSNKNSVGPQKDSQSQIMYPQTEVINLLTLNQTSAWLIQSG